MDSISILILIFVAVSDANVGRRVGHASGGRSAGARGKEPRGGRARHERALFSLAHDLQRQR